MSEWNETGGEGEEIEGCLLICQTPFEVVMYSALPPAHLRRLFESANAV